MAAVEARPEEEMKEVKLSDGFVGTCQGKCSTDASLVQQAG